MNLKEKAYNAIKQRIIEGRYPPGSMLNEKEIIEELEISRTPFREAINVLAKEHLVVIVPRRGMFVADITVKDIVDIYNIRGILEPFAVRLAMQNKIPHEELETFWKKMEDLENKPNAQVAKEDEDLHGMILRYAGNVYLERMMENLYVHNIRVRILSLEKESDRLQTSMEHKKILEAMLEGDIDEAAKRMEQHIEGSKSRAFERILDKGNLAIR